MKGFSIWVFFCFVLFCSASGALKELQPCSDPDPSCACDAGGFYYDCCLLVFKVTLEVGKGGLVKGMLKYHKTHGFCQNNTFFFSFFFFFKIPKIRELIQHLSFFV